MKWARNLQIENMQRRLEWASDRRRPFFLLTPAEDEDVFGTTSYSEVYSTKIVHVWDVCLCRLQDSVFCDELRRTFEGQATSSHVLFSGPDYVLSWNVRAGAVCAVLLCRLMWRGCLRHMSYVMCYTSSYVRFQRVETCLIHCTGDCLGREEYLIMCLPRCVEFPWSSKLFANECYNTSCIKVPALGLRLG